MNNRIAIRVLSDYESGQGIYEIGGDEQNVSLFLTKSIDGDLVIHTGHGRASRKTVRIALSGSRYSLAFKQACLNFYEAAKREMMTTQHEALKFGNPWVEEQELPPITKRIEKEAKTSDDMSGTITMSPHIYTKFLSEESPFLEFKHSVAYYKHFRILVDMSLAMQDKQIQYNITEGDEPDE